MKLKALEENTRDILASIENSPANVEENKTPSPSKKATSSSEKNAAGMWKPPNASHDTSAGTVSPVRHKPEASHILPQSQHDKFNPITMENSTDDNAKSTQPNNATVNIISERIPQSPQQQYSLSKERQLHDTTNTSELEKRTTEALHTPTSSKSFFRNASQSTPGNQQCNHSSIKSCTPVQQISERGALTYTELLTASPQSESSLSSVLMSHLQQGNECYGNVSHQTTSMQNWPNSSSGNQWYQSYQPENQQNYHLVQRINKMEHMLLNAVNSIGVLVCNCYTILNFLWSSDKSNTGFNSP